MTEHQEAYQVDQPTAMDVVIEQRRADTSFAKHVNWTLYTLMLSETAALLHSTSETAQDVLLQVCVQHNSKPAEVLMLVHDYLATFAAWQEHEAEPPEEPVQESLFFGRGEV